MNRLEIDGRRVESVERDFLALPDEQRTAILVFLRALIANLEETDPEDGMAR
jgi:hypothetical protein